jgi:hypothetical protein
MADDIQMRLSVEWGTAIPSSSTGPLAAIEKAAASELASKTAVLAELEDTRLLVGELRESLEVRGDEIRMVTRQWTVRDVVAHLASWARETRHEIESLRRGQKFDYTIHFERDGGPRAWNQREIHVRGSRSVRELFEEFDAETSLLEEIAVSLPDEELRGEIELPRTAGKPPVSWRIALAALLVQSCWHVRYHLSAIEHVRSRS